jgi:hypothetical protein
LPSLFEPASFINEKFFFNEEKLPDGGIAMTAPGES